MQIPTCASRSIEFMFACLTVANNIQNLCLLMQVAHGMYKITNIIIMWSLYVTVCVDAVAMIMTDDSSSGLNYWTFEAPSQMNSFTRSK